MAESHCRRKVSNKIRIHKIFPAFLYKIRRKMYKMRYASKKFHTVNFDMKIFNCNFANKMIAL